MNTATSILNINNVSKSFKGADRQDLLVLDGVYFTLHEGEIIALLGKSGSGKSTLLRIIAGLARPSKGDVLYRDQPVNGPAQGISMVFQSFALMPWLSVLENVELGLEAMGVPRTERRERALKAIDIIGMDGFENAYPKELSGGMRQRVGFARAMVVQPDILLMDEPFSSLDVLTADHLRNDLLELWEQENAMKGILFVTHNIEEAVLMADRILIFGSNPGYISAELSIDLPYPRHSQDPQVLELIDQVYTRMTSVTAEKLRSRTQAKKLTINYRLPDVSIAELIGLLEQLDELQEKGPVDLPDLADEIRLDVDDLFPILETLSVMNLANVSEGDISMTEQAKSLLAADITDKKILFARVLLQHIPLARHIRKVLDERPNHRASQERFIRELEDYFSEEEAERILSTLIDWARYAEILSYDYDTGVLSLEDAE